MSLPMGTSFPQTAPRIAEWNDKRPGAFRRASSPLRPVHHPGNDFTDRSEPMYSGPLARPDPLHHGVNRARLVLRDPDDEGREYRGPIPAVIGHGQPPWARGPRSPPARNKQPAIPWTGRTFSGGALVIR